MALSNIGSRVRDIDDTLTEEQKFRGGSLLIVAGAALVTLLVFVPMTSMALQVVLAVMGVALMVVGTLSVGTSGRRRRPV
ncbi:hypothetical protein ACFQPA_03700 [Halomarina halobia]|uniref:Uncharacterized protein n=1 Tax=Halomarina halobia TaxID=3033386 RepID=A0ABD6A4H7_9EURY|nr:hypothetical protein [Halomarina sp. PSR21]